MDVFYKQLCNLFLYGSSNSMCNFFQEDDPEKQRKWEDRELKRQMKKKAPKMKQLKVKAL